MNKLKKRQHYKILKELKFNSKKKKQMRETKKYKKSIL